MLALAKLQVVICRSLVERPRINPKELAAALISVPDLLPLEVMFL
jgi:hypothetical protein